MADKNIDEYIDSFLEDVQEHLKKIRKLVQKTAPDEKEAMSYGVPAFRLNGKLVLFAAFKKHICLYPKPSVIKKFEEELANYETAKGTIKFPLDRPMPYSLIERMVKFGVKDNLRKWIRYILASEITQG